MFSSFGDLKVIVVGMKSDSLGISMQIRGMNFPPIICAYMDSFSLILDKGPNRENMSAYLYSCKEGEGMHGERQGMPAISSF
ncbi:hypothetical protein JYT58_01180 [bacterium AH-315-G11]|nr:hypothetical protein [bacterium AH-315-G11]